MLPCEEAMEGTSMVPAVPPPASPAAAAGSSNQSQSAIAKERRASRKAAAACLARQRHKSFVNGLQDSGGGLRARIVALRARRGRLQVAVAESMLTQMSQNLAVERMTQVRGWLEGSTIMTPLPLGGAEMACDGDTGSEKNSVSSQPTVATEPECVDDKEGSPPPTAESPTPGALSVEVLSSDDSPAVLGSPTLCLDEELSKQVFMEQAVSAVGAALVEEYSCDYDDDELEIMQGDELQQQYGEGLAALLQHLAHSRQPQIQAWFELKQEMEEEEEEETWTTLDGLEREYLLLSEYHLGQRSSEGIAV